jgi:hypothetical protein
MFIPKIEKTNFKPINYENNEARFSVKVNLSERLLRFHPKMISVRLILKRFRNFYFTTLTGLKHSTET